MLEFSRHARVQMLLLVIERIEVEAVVASPERVDVGEATVRYHGVLGGRLLDVFVLRDSDPPYVVTVSERPPG